MFESSMFSRCAWALLKKKMYKRVKPKQSQMEIVKLKYTITSLSMRRCMVQTVVGGWVAHELLCVEACPAHTSCFPPWGNQMFWNNTSESWGVQEM